MSLNIFNGMVIISFHVTVNVIINQRGLGNTHMNALEWSKWLLLGINWPCTNLSIISLTASKMASTRVAILLLAGLVSKYFEYPP